MLDRVEAAGLLPRVSGPHWSNLSTARTGHLPSSLVALGLLEEVEVEVVGRRGHDLAPAGFRERRYLDDDGRMRSLAPLVSQVLGFDYVWRETGQPFDEGAFREALLRHEVGLRR